MEYEISTIISSTSTTKSFARETREQSKWLISDIYIRFIYPMNETKEINSDYIFDRSFSNLFFFHLSFPVLANFPTFFMLGRQAQSRSWSWKESGGRRYIRWVLKLGMKYCFRLGKESMNHWRLKRWRNF